MFAQREATQTFKISFKISLRKLSNHFFVKKAFGSSFS
jgi:hypothetical protein